MPTAVTESADASALKMKDLETLTGVSREAIHFYLREGLLPEPERPKRNVAIYRDEHVVRIRAIKQLQQERSLSLESIKTMLNAFDYDTLRANDNLSQFELMVHAHVNGDLPGKSQSIEAVAAATGITQQTLQELHDLGVIQIQQRDEQPHLDFRDICIIEQWARLLSLGFADKTGYDSTYLQRFADAMNPIAEQEVAQFLQGFGDKPSDETAELAAQAIGMTNDILSRLRTQALMRALHQQVGGTTNTRI